MKTQTIRVYFEDECPRIGCGWRTVNVRSGRKWIYFVDPYNGNKCRVLKDKALPILAYSQAQPKPRSLSL